MDGLETAFGALARLAALRQIDYELVPWHDIGDETYRAALEHALSKQVTPVACDQIHAFVQTTRFFDAKDREIKTAAFRALLQLVLYRRGHEFSDRTSEASKAWEAVSCGADVLLRRWTEAARKPTEYLSSADGMIFYSESTLRRIRLVVSVSKLRTEDKIGPALAMLLLARAVVSLAQIDPADVSRRTPAICKALVEGHLCAGRCGSWHALPDGVVWTAFCHYVEWVGLSFFSVRPEAPGARELSGWWSDVDVVEWVRETLTKSIWRATSALCLYALFNVPLASACCFNIRRTGPALLGRELWDDVCKWFTTDVDAALEAIHTSLADTPDMFSNSPDEFNWPHALVLAAALYCRQNRHLVANCVTTPCEINHHWRVLCGQANGGLLVMPVARKFCVQVAPVDASSGTDHPLDLCTFASAFDVIRYWRVLSPEGF